jgi:hypothetical protein
MPDINGAGTLMRTSPDFADGHLHPDLYPAANLERAFGDALHS